MRRLDNVLRTNVVSIGVVSIFTVVSAAKCLDEVTGQDEAANPQVVELVLRPSGVLLSPGGTQQFSVYGVTGGGDSVGIDVSWTATGGTITSKGLYVAGEAIGEYEVTTTEAESGLSSSAQVTIQEGVEGEVDGLWVQTGKPYQIVDGLRATDTIPGDTVQQYIDRDREIRFLSPELEGLTFIQTANDDKNIVAVDSFLAFDISEPMAVLVAQTERVSSKPAWLEDFVQTSFYLVNEKDATDTFRIYGRISDPGRIVLGGNVTSAEADDPSVSMYTPILGPPALLEEPVDSDGDGIPDAEDDCPNQPGSPENDGCPEPPPSGQSITGIDFDWSTYTRKAPGSDNWPLTWCADGHQYTSWGDGGGFGGTNSNGRVDIGYARVEGDHPDFTGSNVIGGVNPESDFMFDRGGKSRAILCLNDKVYTWISPGVGADALVEKMLWVSNDRMHTWTEIPEGHLVGADEGTNRPALPFILQQGQENAASDGKSIRSRRSAPGRTATGKSRSPASFGSLGPPLKTKRGPTP